MLLHVYGAPILKDSKMVGARKAALCLVHVDRLFPMGLAVLMKKDLEAKFKKPDGVITDAKSSLSKIEYTIFYTNKSEDLDDTVLKDIVDRPCSLRCRLRRPVASAVQRGVGPLGFFVEILTTVNPGTAARLAVPVGCRVRRRGLT
ncbi:hypothetical protein IscW_ISCW011222 [Ixodes scapularis]|uniref:Uncharacterized protein n=1 Tax=Ixodes scapularis TaxID=6945 RepID=B7Q527_IXOSC|nr:hypothetical protein IscW_ISCW011222 [Ixodes scapularis]|eukprot:XP_002411667.1 hypothetical protein IscW_ISCW011222 [Ixodes scapularis]